MVEDRLAALLRAQGLRVTPQRLAVLSTLRASREHPSAEGVFARVRAKMPQISLATVYKTLTELRRVGEVRVLPVSGKLRFDANAGLRHHHLVCERCRRVVDVRDGIFPPPHLPAEERMGFEIFTADVTFLGMCPACREHSGGAAASNIGRDTKTRAIG